MEPHVSLCGNSHIRTTDCHRIRAYLAVLGDRAGFLQSDTVKSG